MIPALEIGRIVRIAGYSTLVLPNTSCTSACALIWLAGKKRILDGRVGFHAAYRDTEGRLQESGAANALIGNYMTQLGLPAKAILFATAAPPDRILWLTAESRGNAGIEFEVPPPPFEINTRAVPSQPPSQSSKVVPPSQSTPPPVTIISRKELSTGDAAYFDFKYLGLRLRRAIEGPEDPEMELKEFIDDQILEGDGWLYYAFSGKSENKDLTLYYIDTKSLQKNASNVELWVKEDYKFNSKFPHREELIFYKVYCRERAISTLEISKLDSKGNIISRETYDDVKDRIMPGRMDEVLWETVCS